MKALAFGKSPLVVNESSKPSSNCKPKKKLTSFVTEASSEHISSVQIPQTLTKNFELMTTPLITLQKTYTNNVLFISMNLHKHRCVFQKKKNISTDVMI